MPRCPGDLPASGPLGGDAWSPSTEPRLQRSPLCPPSKPDSGLHHRPCHLLSSPTSTSVNPEVCRDPCALWPQEGTAAPWGG